MIVYFALEQKQAIKFMKGKGILPNQGNIATTYQEKKYAIQALKKQLKLSSKKDEFAKVERVDFMLFTYFVPNEATHGVDHPKDILYMKEIYCDNNFPLVNQFASELRYFYLNEKNQIRNRAYGKDVDPELLEKCREADRAYFESLL